MSKKPEFSHPVQIETLTEPKTFEIKASSDQYGPLAARLGIEELRAFSACLTVSPGEKGAVVRLTGTIEADIAQKCVVTLKPVESHISASLDILYSPHIPDANDGDPDEEKEPKEQETKGFMGDAPESLEGSTLDIGEAAVQTLSLEIDPFPRASGAQWQPPEDGGTPTEPKEPKGPFAKLAELKGKMTETPEK